MVFFKELLKKTMNPVYRIYYGQYPDLCTIEIPNDHIREVDTLSFRIEPGKPAEPVTDDVSFTLENLDHDGSQRYPSSWFDDNSRTEENGATYPNQLFFRIVNTTHGISYVGMYKGKKNGAWDETVIVRLKSLLSFVVDGNSTFLKKLTFPNASITSHPNSPWVSINEDTISDGEDLESNEINFSLLAIDSGTGLAKTPVTGSSDAEKRASIVNSEAFSNFLNRNEDFLSHYNLFDESNFVSSVAEGITYLLNEVRPIFVKIGEMVILSRVRVAIKEFITNVSGLQYSCLISIHVTHANNGNIEDNDVVHLERGRFFSDKKGTNYSTGDAIELTLYDVDLGYDVNVLVAKSSFPPLKDYQWVHGVICELSATTLILQNYAIAYINIINESLSAIAGSLFNAMFSEEVSISDIFDTSWIGGNQEVFLADILQYAWLSEDVGEVLVALAMQTNSYLFVNELGKIVFQNRLMHEDYLPGSLPPDTLYIAPEHIEPLGGEDDTNGFDSYKIVFEDRIEINNVESGTSYTSFVSKDGTLSKPKLRNSSIEVNNYRTSDLGIPGSNDHPDLPVFRYSPDHASFPGTKTMADFITDPVTQAQNFAKSFSYPTIIWNIRISMAYYTTAKIGRYFWTVKDGTQKCYLIKQIHFDQDGYMIKIQAQYVGEYSGS